MKRVTQPHKPVEHVQEVKQLRVDGLDLIGVMISQNVANIPGRVSDLDFHCKVVFQIWTSTVIYAMLTLSFERRL